MAAKLEAKSAEFVIDVPAALPSADPIRVQYAAGFYPSGSVVAVRVRAGRRTVAEVLLNPNVPEVAAGLRRLSKSREVLVRPAGSAEPVAIPQGGMARQELQALLSKIGQHRPARLDWQAARAEYRNSAWPA